MTVDYKCDECGTITESDGENSKELLCCGQVMRRVYSVPAVKFVGMGFYTNDYPKQVKRKR